MKTNIFSTMFLILSLALLGGCKQQDIIKIGDQEVVAPDIGNCTPDDKLVVIWFHTECRTEINMVIKAYYKELKKWPKSKDDIDKFTSNTLKDLIKVNWGNFKKIDFEEMPDGNLSIEYDLKEYCNANNTAISPTYGKFIIKPDNSKLKPMKESN